MGCDIHMYAEKQVSNNTDIYWEMIGDIFLNEYYGEYVDIYKNRLSDSFDFSVVWMYTWFRLENIKLKLDEHPGLQYRDRDNNWFTNNKGMLNFYKMYKNGQYKIDENIILDMF